MSLPSLGHEDRHPEISRRCWLALAASSLAGCGGGGGGSGVAGLPGTGGTGIYAQGSISGFGSVIVNSVKYDDTLAQVQIDGATASAADLRLGMVAEVQGQRSADPALGTASSIVVWSIAQGRITQVQSGQFTLMGMTIQTDSGTVFDGLASASALAVGQRVSVWGLEYGIDGVRWTATRVAITPDTTVSVVSGLVKVVGTQRSVNGNTLSGNGVSALSVGQWIRAQGALSGSTLQTSSLQLPGVSTGAVPTGDGEIEGVVTLVLSKTRFFLGTVEIDASSTAVSSALPLVATGSRLEVNGTWQGRVLKATAMSAEDDTSIQSVEIEATIQTYVSLANFTVRGQVCNASATPNLSSSTRAKLKVGTKVKLEGTKSGDVVLVTKLEVLS
jgi:hypothetical protein